MNDGMDTTYITIMLVVFLVLTGLAIDIGYMYVSEEDLQSAAQSAALAGAQSIKQRTLFQIKNDPAKIEEAASDTVQEAARNAALENLSAKSATALVGLANNNGNALTGDNDITVGFWNMSSHSYIPGGKPVNAIQVRTKRTAESSSVGMGSLGSFLAKITGTETFGLTPVAVAAIPVGTTSKIAICSAACDPGCTYPKICTINERKMTRAPWEPAKGQAPSDRFVFTSLLHPASITNTMSDLVCHEGSPQDVCGRPIYTAAGTGNDVLRDIRAMMYDPDVDRTNKEYDKDGKVVGWWAIVPVTDCAAIKSSDVFEPHAVTKYSLVRISRICAAGPAGCREAGVTPVAPACSAGEEGVYIDHISCVGCGSRSRMLLPGLQPVIVQ
jgi:Flp pilus assembly protein TadG